MDLVIRHINHLRNVEGLNADFNNDYNEFEDRYELEEKKLIAELLLQLFVFLKGEAKVLDDAVLADITTRLF